MTTLDLHCSDWCAWSEPCDSFEDWSAWEPTTTQNTAGPKIDFVPPMIRRRCSPLTRAMIWTAWHALEGDADRARLARVVFVSRYGEINKATSLISANQQGRASSPNGFSLSVHNGPLGMFSLIFGNKQPATAIAGGHSNLAAGLLAARLQLQQAPTAEVLLVLADEAVPEPFASTTAAPQSFYAAALALRSEPTETKLTLSCDDASTSQDAAIPEGLGFIHWLTSGKDAILLAGVDSGWRCQRYGNWQRAWRCNVASSRP